MAANWRVRGPEVPSGEPKFVWSSAPERLKSVLSTLGRCGLNAIYPIGGPRLLRLALKLEF